MKKYGAIALLLSIIMLLSSFSAMAAVTRGDVDGNGSVTSNDAIYLLYHVFFPNDYKLNQSGDMDGNKKVNSDDAIYLLYHIFFPKDYKLANDTNEGGINTGGTDSEGGEYGPFIPFKKK